MTKQTMRHSALSGVIHALVLGLVLSGCGDLDYNFDFSLQSPPFCIVADLAEAVPCAVETEIDETGEVVTEQGDSIVFLGGWTGFGYAPTLEDLPDEFAGLSVSSVSLIGFDVESGEPLPLNFVQRLDALVVGEGSMPSFLLATYTSEPGTMQEQSSTLGMTVVEHVNVLDHITSGSQVFAFIQGMAPSRDIGVRLQLDLRGYTVVK